MRDRYDFGDAPRGVLHGKIKSVHGKVRLSAQEQTITVNLTTDEARAVAVIVAEMTPDELSKLAGMSDTQAKAFLAQARTAVDKMKAA